MVLDLTPPGSTTISSTSASGSGFVVASNEVQPTGTGVINPFLTIQQNGFERGFNTSIGLPLDTKRSGGGFTRAIQLGDIASVTIGGTEYLQFLLDVNQVANGNLSLNQVQIFTSPADLGNSSFTLTEASPNNAAILSFGATNNEVFRLNNFQNNGTDLATNTEIWIDSGHGSGSGDMFLYVDASLFGSDPNAYVTLFSQFGRPSGTFDSNDGFEEWATRQSNTPVQSVPVPPAIFMLLSGAPLLLLGFRRRKPVAA